MRKKKELCAVCEIEFELEEGTATHYKTEDHVKQMQSMGFFRD
jgi:hypothetical protein